MKIAIVGPFFLPQIDGVEKVMLYHARYLAQRGHDVHVITSNHRFPTGHFANLPEEEHFDGFTIHRIRVVVRSPSRLFYYLSNSGLMLRGFSSLLSKLSPDIVHVHNVASPAWAHAAARYTQRHRRKLFYSAHYHPDCLELPKWHTSLVHALNRLPLNQAKRIFHLTAADFYPFAQEYPEVPRSRLEVLPNGVLPPASVHQTPLSSEALNILFVGRVEDHRKGFDLLENAYAEARRPEWTLTVVGRISEQKRTSLQTRFGAAVRILGLVDEATLEKEYAAASIFVMPSRYEGFGMPYIEAMRYGVPVIGTRVGGIPETVPEGTGILIDSEDERGLLEAIVRLGASPEARAAIGSAGKAWSRRFHWDRIVDQLETNYAA